MQLHRTHLLISAPSTSTGELPTQLMSYHRRLSFGESIYPSSQNWIVSFPCPNVRGPILRILGHAGFWHLQAILCTYGFKKYTPCQEHSLYSSYIFWTFNLIVPSVYTFNLKFKWELCTTIIINNSILQYGFCAVAQVQESVFVWKHFLNEWETIAITCLFYTFCCSNLFLSAEHIQSVYNNM